MILDALLSLMKKYPYNEITITQICQEAKVVRQTFYRNFEAKSDILELYIDNIFKDFVSNRLSIKGDMYKQLLNFFQYINNYKNFLILLEKNNLFHLLDSGITKNIPIFITLPPVIETSKEGTPDIYVIGFIASTVCSILSLWVKSDFKDSLEMLANMTTAFLSCLNHK